LVLIGAFFIAATFAVAYVLLPFIPGFVRMYNGGNFGTTTHLGSFVVSCAFVAHYVACGSANFLIRQVFHRFSTITDDVQHLGNMQIHNLKELHQWQVEVTALKKKHAVTWANFERMCAGISLGVIVCDAYLYRRGFRAGQSLNDSSYLDGNFLTLYAVSIVLKAGLVAAGAYTTDLHEKYIQASTSKLRSKQMDELAHQSELGSMNQNSQDDLANYIDHVIHFLESNGAQFTILGVIPTKKKAAAVAATLLLLVMGILTKIALAFVSEETFGQIMSVSTTSLKFIT
jgi:hypothetical protein